MNQPAGRLTVSAGILVDNRAVHRGGIVMEHTNEVYKDIDLPSVWLSALVMAVFMIFAALVVHSGTCLADATETNYSPVRSNQFFLKAKLMLTAAAHS